MSALDDGGPAFPMQDPQAIHSYAAAKTFNITDPAERDRVYIHARAQAVGGASLRDYFAAKAMAQLVNGPAAQNICDHDQRYDQTNFAAVVAINAYEFADAMLKARQA